jgi:hypothetical protein
MKNPDTPKHRAKSGNLRSCSLFEHFGREGAGDLLLHLFNEAGGRVVKEDNAAEQFLIIAVKSQCDRFASLVIPGLDLSRAELGVG